MSEHSTETKPGEPGFVAADTLAEQSGKHAPAKDAAGADAFDDDCGDSSGGGKS